MNWDAIQSVCFLILAGSMAVVAFVMYRITRDLLRMRTEILIALAELRAAGRARKSDTVSVSPGCTVTGDG